MHTRLLRQLIAIPVLLPALAGLYACGSNSSKAAAAPPRTSAVYALAPGQSVMLAPGTSVRLDRVNDSRCAPGQVCVWDGYLSYRFMLASAGASSSFVLADHMPGASRSVRQGGLTFTLESGDTQLADASPAQTPDYRVNLRVSIR